LITDLITYTIVKFFSKVLEEEELQGRGESGDREDKGQGKAPREGIFPTLFLNPDH
jgi:hypothetical protein